MKTIILSACVALSTVCAMSSIADTVSADASSAGTYVKDSAITTKVKAKLAEKHLSTLTKISAIPMGRCGVVERFGHQRRQDPLNDHRTLTASERSQQYRCPAIIPIGLSDTNVFPRPGKTFFWRPKSAPCVGSIRVRNRVERLKVEEMRDLLRRPT